MIHILIPYNVKRKICRYKSFTVTVNRKKKDTNNSFNNKGKKETNQAKPI